MATLADGAPAFTAVAGATALAADQNTLQALLIAMLEARNGTFWQGTPCHTVGAGAAAFTNWDIQEGTGAVVADAGFMFWEASGNDVAMLFPLTGLMVGQVITTINLIVGGHNNSTGGSIDLYYGAPATNRSVQDLTAATANVFDPNGGGLDDSAFPIVYNTTAVGVLPLTVVANFQYYIVVQASAANGSGNRVYDVRVEAQFGV